MPTASPYHVTYLDFIVTAMSDTEHNLLSAFILRVGTSPGRSIIEYAEYILAGRCQGLVFKRQWWVKESVSLP